MSPEGYSEADCRTILARTEAMLSVAERDFTTARAEVAEAEQSRPLPDWEIALTALYLCRQSRDELARRVRYWRGRVQAFEDADRLHEHSWRVDHAHDDEICDACGRERHYTGQPHCDA